MSSSFLLIPGNRSLTQNLLNQYSRAVPMDYNSAGHQVWVRPVTFIVEALAIPAAALEIIGRVAFGILGSFVAIGAQIALKFNPADSRAAQIIYHYKNEASTKLGHTIGRFLVLFPALFRDLIFGVYPRK